MVHSHPVMERRPSFHAMHPLPNLRRRLAITAISMIFLGIAMGLPSARTLYTQAQPLEAKTFDIASDPDFKDYKQVVARFAGQRRPRAENNFCILGSSGDKVKSAWVLWREGAQIILWEGGGDLSLSRRVIHLPSDVVPSESDLHGSTYLVTRSWVDDLTKSCERLGVQVHISKVKSTRKQ